MKKFPLASVEKIILLEPLLSRSKAFEKATLSNYHQVIFKKGSFKFGDMCVFFKENSELGEPLNFVVKRKTIAGQVSEGVCFPLSILPKNVEAEVGKDVSKILNVKFYDIHLISQKAIQKEVLVKELKAFAKNLIEQIKKVFSGVTLGDGISLQEAREIDDRGDPKSVHHLDERENWQKVTSQDLEKYADSLYSFSDENGKKYYLPAYMCLGLGKFIATGSKPFFAYWQPLPTFGIAFDFSSLLYVEEFSNLTNEQLETLKQYVSFLLAYDELAYDEKDLTKFSKIINKYPIKKTFSAPAKRRSNFINRPSKIRNKK